jgi:type IV pilus secretin PilQ/predicted competence protein
MKRITQASLALIGVMGIALWQSSTRFEKIITVAEFEAHAADLPSIASSEAKPLAEESPILAAEPDRASMNPTPAVDPGRASTSPTPSEVSPAPSKAETDAVPARLLRAKTLKKIEVKDQPDAVSVVLTGDGDFSFYQVFRLSGNRVVIDLEDVTVNTKRRTVAVDHPLLRQIRVGSNTSQRRVRLVMDLTRAVTYSIEKNATQLLVLLAEPGGKPAAAAPLAASTKPVKPLPPPLDTAAKVLEPTPSAVPEASATALEPMPSTAPESSVKAPEAVPSPPETASAKAPEPLSSAAAASAKRREAASRSAREGESRGTDDKPLGKRFIRPAAAPAPLLRIQDIAPQISQPSVKPPVSVLEPGERYTGKRISLDFQDAEISSVLRLIADVSGFNMVVGEGAKAKVTLKLLNVPWDQALELILKLNQLGQIREGNIIWIDSLSNISKQKDEAVRAHESTLKAEPLGTRIMYLNYADAQKSLDIVKSTLSTRGEVKVDLRTNALVVKDIGDNLRKIEKLLRDLDRVTPQVQIEARIVQASKAFARGIGVQWGISSMNSTHVGSQGPITVNLGRAGAAFSVDETASTFLVNLPSTATGVNIPTSALGLTIGRFLGTTGTLDLRLSAGESLGLTKIVSAPKIITLDHKPAKIEQGSQVPFQTTSLQGTQTTFVDATLTLNVTPHVIPFAQTIRLEIKATKNSVGAAVSQAGPTIDKKEATTEVLLRDGETTVLGGIFEENRSDSTQGMPWFNRIPFLGWLFKTEGVSLAQTELLVFVTPIILKD